MKKITVIEASEQEILDIINEYFGINEDSIVALEELGNQVWCVRVGPVSEFDKKQGYVSDVLTNGNYQYNVGVMLDILCDAGKLEAGDYQIDCTW